MRLLSGNGVVLGAGHSGGDGDGYDDDDGEVGGDGEGGEEVVGDVARLISQSVIEGHVFDTPVSSIRSQIRSFLGSYLRITGAYLTQRHEILIATTMARAQSPKISRHRNVLLQKLNYYRYLAMQLYSLLDLPNHDPSVHQITLGPTRVNVLTSVFSF